MISITMEGAVVKVIDGDTLDIEVKRTVRIRLLDLWAAETRTTDEHEKRLGTLAKNQLSRTLWEGSDVEFTIPIDALGKFGDSMSFGRILASVRTKSGVDVAELMRNMGQGFLTRDLLEAHIEGSRPDDKKESGELAEA